MLHCANNDLDPCPQAWSPRLKCARQRPGMKNRIIGITASVLDYCKGRIVMKTSAHLAEWIEKAMLLSKDDAERILARMRKKITRKMKQDEIDPLVAVALQLQLEDEQLKEWRGKIAELRERG
ncbi:MAG: hypothetical protein NTV11_19780 [Rhodocyclales bacterium]|nr:hypothetical protein [Rhodocyclales bacterium]